MGHVVPCWDESVVVQGPAVCRDASVYSAPEARPGLSTLNVSRANVSYEGLILSLGLVRRRGGGHSDTPQLLYQVE